MRILNTMAARAIPFVPRFLIRKISRRYIAGATLADALTRVKSLHAAGYRTTLDVLGETVSSSAEVEAVTSEYLALIDALHANGVRTELSIKPSALGMLFDDAACKTQVLRILDAVTRCDVNACIDMEDVTCTQRSLDLFANVEGAGDVGIALQAYLKRTYDDIAQLQQRMSRLRICKGIYSESDVHLVPGASRDRRAINEHLVRHVSSALQAGSFVGIATHDEALIESLITWIRRMRSFNDTHQRLGVAGMLHGMRAA
ncbi:proline dehydrogenase family protein [Burkholderia cenocepacia]|uniref:proline dehydrogenase family protein n=1 Tax=Burkholderia cenocepacia TaxID=95486 RepID=UPI00158A6137|nr:proline dehydrogenase family protein [Burkholderia cenocepacia]